MTGGPAEEIRVESRSGATLQLADYRRENPGFPVAGFLDSDDLLPHPHK